MAGPRLIPASGSGRWSGNSEPTRTARSTLVIPRDRERQHLSPMCRYRLAGAEGMSKKLLLALSTGMQIAARQHRSSNSISSHTYLRRREAG